MRIEAYTDTIQAYPNANTNTHMHIHTYTYTYTHTCTCMHAGMHICEQTYALNQGHIHQMWALSTQSHLLDPLDGHLQRPCLVHSLCGVQLGPAGPRKRLARPPQSQQHPAPPKKGWRLIQGSTAAFARNQSPGEAAMPRVSVASS